MPTDSASGSFSRSATRARPMREVTRRWQTRYVSAAPASTRYQYAVLVRSVHGPSVGGGTPGTPSGPLVSSIQLMLTSEMTPAKLIVTSTKYAPRSLSASRPMAQPANPDASAAAGSASQNDHCSGGSESSAEVYAPMPKNAAWPSESCPV